jgi:putative transposase
MTYDPEKHHRRSVRLDHYDYRNSGAYFVTICTHARQCIFGTIENVETQLSRSGMIVEKCWNAIAEHRPTIELDYFQIMPNHMHGILFFHHVGATLASPSSTRPINPQRPNGPIPNSLGAVIGGFKSAVTREINRIRPGAGDRLWQASYYDHIIRNNRSLELIREYIYTNPRRWELDRENPEGSGADDVEEFVRTLGDSSTGNQGDASVAPTSGRERVRR